MLTKEHLDLLEKLQPLFYRVQDDRKGDDRFYCYTCETYFLQKDGDCHCNSDEAERWIRIPDLYSRDPDRPERGLWGMVDWKRWAISLGIDGSMVLDDMDDTSESNRYSTDWNTPTIALLKALAWQEGV